MLLPSRVKIIAGPCNGDYGRPLSSMTLLLGERPSKAEDKETRVPSVSYEVRLDDGRIVTVPAAHTRVVLGLD